MSEGTLPVLTHPSFPQVFKEAIEHVYAIPDSIRTDEQRKEHNAATLVALWNLGAVLRCSLCGMADGKPGEVHVVGHEPLCLPCAEELFG